MNAAARKKFFTVSEANSRLPLVKAIVNDVMVLYKDLQERSERLEAIKRTRGSNPPREGSLYAEEVEQTEAELEKDFEKLRAFEEELEELGVELKDRSLGLIDFPTLIDGREAYLCWRAGEEEVAYWHELNAGYGGRQMLLQELVSTDEDTQENS